MKTRNSARAVILIALAGVCILATSASDPVYQNTKQIVTLALLGDISLARGVQPEADSFSALAAQLNSADLALANLESPLDPQWTPSEQNPSTPAYNLCAPAERAELLKGWGLDLLSLANNHAFDCSPDGLTQTVAALGSQNLIGIRSSSIDGTMSSPYYRNVNGLSLAFLAFDDVTQPIDIEAAAAEVQTAKNQGALVVVSVHWGAEYQAGASPRQKEVAKALAKAGAVLIWGHHPHVLQPSEWLQTENGSTLVFYSLGNALFDQYGLADTSRSALILVMLDAQGIVDVEAFPFVIDAKNSCVVPADLSTKQKILQRLSLP
ncbi:MAG TPA: CapA family protein [Anaerolineaceae bacterium]|nr:CapA family protein [Anaerolineaceae bacterium]